MITSWQEYPSTAFEVYHKIDQVVFKWELLVAENAQSISKRMLLLKVLLYSLGATLNVHD